MSPTPNPSAPAQGTPTTNIIPPKERTTSIPKALHEMTEDDWRKWYAGTGLRTGPCLDLATQLALEGHTEVPASRREHSIGDPAFIKDLRDPNAHATLTAERDALKAEAHLKEIETQGVLARLRATVSERDNAETVIATVSAERDRLRDACEAAQGPLIYDVMHRGCGPDSVAHKALRQIQAALASTAPSETARLRESNAELVKALRRAAIIWKAAADKGIAPAGGLGPINELLLKEGGVS